MGDKSPKKREKKKKQVVKVVAKPATSVEDVAVKKNPK
jgi:hypothetical protein